MTFLKTLLHNCQTYPDKPALEFIYRPESGDKRIVSYGQLEETVKRTMHYLRQMGVQPGERVALQLPKCLPFLYLHLATLRLGAVTLPLNPAYPQHELRYFLSDSGASLFVGAAATEAELTPTLAELPALRKTIFLDAETTHSFAQLLASVAGTGAELPPIPPDSGATALMIYTSGTTGRPKGAQITHGNLTANLAALHTAWGWRQDDVLLHVLPIFHVHGLVVALHGALHAGATAVLLPQFDPHHTLNTLVQRQCTVFMAVPTIYRRLLQIPQPEAYDLSHMRLLTSGSDRLPDDLFWGFRQAFGHTLLERYGMTETGMNLSNPLHGERRAGSVGLPLPGVEVRVVDPESGRSLPDNEVGELQIRGDHVFKGYWQQPQKTAAAFTEDGWLRTGDLGLREPDGYFTLKGRAKDLIISGGLNVYPPEVELVLAAHEAVAAAAVIGCPDEEWGERVTAVVVAKPGPSPTTAAIIDHCRAHLAAYKAPKQVHFVEVLPRNAMGKVQKAKLRERMCG